MISCLDQARFVLLGKVQQTNFVKQDDAACFCNGTIEPIHAVGCNHIRLITLKFKQYMCYTLRTKSQCCVEALKRLHLVSTSWHCNETVKDLSFENFFVKTLLTKFLWSNLLGGSWFFVSAISVSKFNILSRLRIFSERLVVTIEIIISSQSFVLRDLSTLKIINIYVEHTQEFVNKKLFINFCFRFYLKLFAS